MQLNRSTFFYLMYVLLVFLLACKSGANSSFEAKRASDWKKYQKSQKRKKKMNEKAYKTHLKNQSKPMRKLMKRDIRRMRKAKRKAQHRYV